MNPEDVLRRAIATEVRDVNEEERSLVAYASTKSTDSYDEVLLPDSFDLTRYQKNPIVQWAHEYRLPPVGRAMWIKPDKQGLLFKPQFARTQFADDVFELYRGNFLRGFSVGFMPMKWLEPDNDGYDEIKEKWELEGEPRRIYTKNELYEVSAVPLPANADALALMLQNGLIHSKALEAYFVDLEVAGATSFADLPTASEDTAWNAGKARKQLAAWASSDGSGDKDKMSWSKYRKGFFWVDSSEPESFGSYKLPFAYVDGGLKAVWRGVASGMATLLGGRGGVDIPDADRKPVYNHMVRYYKKFDKEPPEFKEIIEQLEELQEKMKAMGTWATDLQEKIDAMGEWADEMEAFVKDQHEKKEKIVPPSGISPEEARGIIAYYLPQAIRREIRRLQGKID